MCWAIKTRPAIQEPVPEPAVHIPVHVLEPIPILVPPVVVPVPPVARMHVFAYGDFSERDVSLLIAARPAVAVVNTPSGFWGRNYGAVAQCWSRSAIEALQAVGTHVLGYTTSGYAGKGSAGHPLSYVSLDNVLDQITKMATEDDVDGIFLDEVDADPSPTDKEYYAKCVDLAHSLSLRIWGNAGVNGVAEWLFNGSEFDIIHCTEQWRAGQSISPIMSRYFTHVAVAGYGAWTLTEAKSAMQTAYDQGVAYAYCGAQDWTTLPPFLVELAEVFR